MTEIERLVKVSMNSNPTKWESKSEELTTKVSFLNCRSIKNKFQNIKSDRSLLKSDIFVLTETWLEEDTNLSEYQMPEFDTDFNNRGRGKGIASYYNGKFKHAVNINCEGVSISKLESENIDIIGIYRSQGGNDRDLIDELEVMVDRGKNNCIRR